MSDHQTRSEPVIRTWSTQDRDFANEWLGESTLGTLKSFAGAWAFCIQRPDGTATLARDVVGVQPLYYATSTDGSLHVSPRIADLLDTPGISHDLDYDAIALRILRNRIDRERTEFAAIKQVPAGSIAHWDGRQMSVETYWSAAEVPDPDESLSFDDCVDRIREALHGSVRRAIGSAMRVGSHVSGGLDCSAVAVLAHHELRSRGSGLTRGFSWSPTFESVPALERDERRLVGQVATKAGFPIDFIDPDTTDDTWYRQANQHRMPNPMSAAEPRIVPAIAARGVAVTLSGWGGDEFLSHNGRSVYSYLQHERQYRQLRTEVLARGRTVGRSTVRSWASYAKLRLSPLVARFGRDSADEREERLLAAAAESSQFVYDRHQEWLTASNQARSPRQTQEVLLRAGFLQARVATWQEMGSDWGFTYGFPMLDVASIETALQLPWWAYKHQGWGRAAYRKAVEPFLPPEVVWNLTKTDPAAVTGARQRSATSVGPRMMRSEDPRIVDLTERAQAARLRPESGRREVLRSAVDQRIR